MRDEWNDLCSGGRVRLYMFNVDGESRLVVGSNEDLQSRS